MQQDNITTHLLQFNSEYECGNLECAYFYNPEAGSEEERIDSPATPSELFPDIDAHYGVPT
jgi:rubredoxin